MHGLTTATSVWLSAAIGILCGGGLFVPGLFTTSVGVVYLRFAPRLSHGAEEHFEADPPEAHEAANSLLQPLNPQETSLRESARVSASQGLPGPEPSDPAGRKQKDAQLCL